MLYRGPQCALHPHQRIVYLHHGSSYCALCLPDEPTEDVIIRSRLMQLKAQALRAAVCAARRAVLGDKEP